MAEQYYEERGRYTVCWCGPIGKRVYVAWYMSERIGVFKQGDELSLLQAARNACNEHCIKNNKKAGEDGTELDVT